MKELTSVFIDIHFPPSLRSKENFFYDLKTEYDKYLTNFFGELSSGKYMSIVPGNHMIYVYVSQDFQALYIYFSLCVCEVVDAFPKSNSMATPFSPLWLRPAHTGGVCALTRAAPSRRPRLTLNNTDSNLKSMYTTPTYILTACVLWMENGPVFLMCCIHRFCRTVFFAA